MYLVTKIIIIMYADNSNVTVTCTLPLTTLFGHLEDVVSHKNTRYLCMYLYTLVDISVHFCAIPT